MNILIIDDMQADHDLCMEYLGENAGEYRFFHAYNGREGLSVYQNNPIDCVLLDYNLPDMSGLEVLKELSMKEEVLPVLMLTGEGDEVVAVTAMKFGSQDYIPKRTITSSALKRAVDRAAERAELLKQMEKYKSDLERSNSDLEQFSNIVAHDLKSPLRAITQHLTLIRNKCESQLDEKSLQSLGFAVDGAERMRALIDALFTYAKLGFSDQVFGAVDTEAVLKSVLEDLSVSIEESGATVRYDPMPQVWGDAALLEQLLLNLVANAIKYCREKPGIFIGAARQGERWEFFVRDNGIGIPQGQQQKIFAIFRRLHDEEYPGIGLGLAVCERIVKQHGGKIWVESEPDKGATFYFTLSALEASSGKRKVAHA